MPEVVEAGAEHVGQRREGADVAAQIPPVLGVVAVGLDHHRHRVPAHVGAQALLDLDVAGAARFLVRLDRVDVAGVGRERHVDAVLAGVLEQVFEQLMGAFAAFGLDHGAEGIEPLAGFLVQGFDFGLTGLALWLGGHAVSSGGVFGGVSGPRTTRGRRAVLHKRPAISNRAERFRNMKFMHERSFVSGATRIIRR